MAYASKSAQRLARSTDARGADSTVNSNSVEMKNMAKSRPELTGGSLGAKGRGGDALTGGSMGVKSSPGALVGPLGKSGVSSSYHFKVMTDSSPGKGRTTRTKLGRTGDSFQKKG